MQLQTVWPGHCRAVITSANTGNPIICSGVWSGDGRLHKMSLTRTSSQKNSNEKMQDTALNPRQVKTPSCVQHCNSSHIYTSKIQQHPHSFPPNPFPSGGHRVTICWGWAEVTIHLSDPQFHRKAEYHNPQHEEIQLN